MLEKINLLPTKRAISPRERKIRLWLKLASVIVLGVYIFSILSLSSYLFFLNGKNKSLDGEIASLNGEIKGLEERETAYRHLVIKLNDLATILEKRPDFGEVFDYLEKYGFSGIELDNVEVEKEGDLDFEGVARDSFVLDELIEMILADEGYKRATLVGVARNKADQLEFELKTGRDFYHED